MEEVKGGTLMTGWLYPVLLIIGAIVVCTAGELFTIAICDKAAGKTVYAIPDFKREGQPKAA